MRVLYSFIIIGLLTLSSCGGSKNLQLADGQKLEKGIYAKMETTKGDIILKLYDEEAPLTVANFVGLAQGKLTVFDTIKFTEPYYDGIVFHRVIPNFMIQGGDPTGSGQGGPGYKFWDETSNTDSFGRKGLLAMANAGPKTNGSQFFITHVPTPHLNGKHTIFGEVLEGQDVVDAIEQGDKIEHVKIFNIGKKFNATKVFKSEYDAIKLKEEEKELEERKLRAKDNARLEVAKSKNQMEYRDFFYDLVKEREPNAVQTESGLVYVIRKDGEGANPEKGDHVSLHYLGEFINGGKFDSSYDRNQPLSFDYLIMGLIPGFNEGVGLSNKGMEVDLFIPYYLAYGKNGRPTSIPQYADLIFRLKILDVQAK